MIRPHLLGILPDGKMRVSADANISREQDAHSRNNCALDLAGNRIKERYEPVGYGKQMSVRGVRWR